MSQFPIIHWEDGTSTAVPENELPLVLPVTKDIRPSGTGESPLANLTDWSEVTREDGVRGRRETNTMPQWAGSSWYYLRYIDPHNTEKLADEGSPKTMVASRYLRGWCRACCTSLALRSFLAQIPL